MKTRRIQFLIGTAALYFLAAAISTVGAATNGIAGSGTRSDEMIRAGTIKFTGLSIPKVLEIYTSLSDAKPDLDSGVKNLPVLITFENKSDMKRSEVVRLLEKALHDQAGVLVTHPDPKHFVVRLRTSRDDK